MQKEKNQDAFKLYVDEREGRYLPTIRYRSIFRKLLKRKERHDTDDANPRYMMEVQDGYNAAIILRQYIYGRWINTKSSIRKQNIKIEQIDIEVLYAIENTILETVKSYNSLVQSDEILVLTEDMIKIHEDNLITAKEKEEISGEVLETYQVTSKLYFMKDRFIEEEDIKESGIALFKKYTGVEPNGKTCRPNIDESVLPKNLDEMIKKAVLNNHRILEQIERIKIQREKIAQYDATFLPSLNIELKATYDDDLELC